MIKQNKMELSHAFIHLNSDCCLLCLLCLCSAAECDSPISGTDSEVAGMISATSSMKTVRESRTVIPEDESKMAFVTCRPANPRCTVHIGGRQAGLRVFSLAQLKARMFSGAYFHIHVYN